MSDTQVLPDVEVDESELTQQPCGTEFWTAGAMDHQCPEPAVGEDLVRCIRNDGHTRHVPRCDRHLGGRCDWASDLSCKTCLGPADVVVSRRYARRTS